MSATPRFGLDEHRAVPPMNTAFPIPHKSSSYEPRQAQCSFLETFIDTHGGLRTFLTQAGTVAPTDAAVLFSGETEVRVQNLPRFALLHVLGLVICLLLFGGRCAAQEIDVPTGRGNGAVVAPTGWTELIAPVQQRVELEVYGFYIGDLKAPSAQFDATFRATKFLSITPSYLHYSIPASGLDDLANRSGGFTRTVEEHQFRIDGTVMFSVRKFEITQRNMYVRRFLPTYVYAGRSLPAKEINRYRNRIRVAYPLAVKGHIWKPFVSYEAFYDQGSGWTKNRVWTGVTVPLRKDVSFQPSYMWEGTQGIKDVKYLMFGLIFRTGSTLR
jgi:Protein of unknown function (DUF2490)